MCIFMRTSHEYVLHVMTISCWRHNFQLLKLCRSSLMVVTIFFNLYAFILLTSTLHVFESVELSSTYYVFNNMLRKN